MTVYREKGRRIFRYDFWFRGRRYTGSTEQLEKADAEAVEHEHKRKLRHQAGGILP